MISRFRYIGHLVFTYLIILTFVACSTKDPVIQGKYISNNDKNPKNIKLAFTLIDSENNEKTYYAFIKEDGAFRVKVKERGERLLFVHINTVFNSDWVNPTLSSEHIPYIYKFEDNETITLDQLYISEQLSLTFPAPSPVSVNELIIKWDPVDFADFYTILIYKQENKDYVEYANITNIRKSSISYEEIIEATKVGNDLQSDNIFIEKFSPLEKGNYHVYVDAVKLWPEKKLAITVGCSSPYKEDNILNIQ